MAIVLQSVGGMFLSNVSTHARPNFLESGSSLQVALKGLE